MLKSKFNNKKVFIIAGGTGGHLFPALAICETLLCKDSDITIGIIGKEAVFQHFQEFENHRLELFSMKNSGKNLLSFGKTFIESFAFLKQNRPSILIGFGSRYQAPFLISALVLGIPYILHEANALAGRANRIFSKGALWTGIFFEAAKKNRISRSKQVDYPLRRHFFEIRETKEGIRKRLGLFQDRKTLLVLGGSQGAGFLNRAVPDALSKINRPFQVIHLTGNGHDIEAIRRSYRKDIPLYIRHFESDMASLWKAADLACTRAGAGTIAEMLHFEIPALFIPYPHALDNHQEKNAKEIADRGLALYVRENHAIKEGLKECLNELFDKEKSIKHIFSLQQKKAFAGSFAMQILESLHALSSDRN